MIIKRAHIIPDPKTIHVADGFENPCEECENWGEECEICNASVPLVADKHVMELEEKHQVVMCGIPVGRLYKIRRN